MQKDIRGMLLVAIIAGFSVALAACGDDDVSDLDAAVEPDASASQQDSQVGNADAVAQADSSAVEDAETADAAPADASTTPPGHNESLGTQGALHASGKSDPKTNCVACHGDDLAGGTSGQSCYTCHNSDDHTKDRDGKPHLENGNCATCHGPSNSGGLGPACVNSGCHSTNP